MYKRILVPLDGSKEAEHALPHVKTAATGYDPPAKVIVFTAIGVWQKMGPDIAATITATGHVVQTDKSHDSLAKQYIKTIVDNLRSEGIDAEDAIIETIPNQDVAEEILRYVDSEEIDLIIMTTHGRSGPKRWAFGSVADKVVRHSKVPVSVVPPHGYREGK